MAKRSFKSFVEQELGKFPEFLIYAVLEWVLIFVLFIDGFLAFFANEYARFFELRIPCLFCTRIDHLLVHRDADFYCNDSMCESHKKDLSSLAYCHVHKKLSDIRRMCEGCLLSFATQKESDCETYKSLVGILHKDVDMFVDDDSEIHYALASGRKEELLQAKKSNPNRCFCCGELLKVMSYPKGRKGCLFAQAPTPSPRAPFANLKNEEPRHLDLPHIPFKELKLSDNESDLLDDVHGSNASILDRQVREDLKASAPSLSEIDYMNDDRTPTFARGNRFFGIPLDSAAASPRWSTRFAKRSLLEKTEFASESTEGSASSEAEADSVLLNLKSQVKLDHKSLMALYMELDEERSASAIAANNAMAMITRLQAEKAAVQMEALQYQRMMEEQAEYDQEALQEASNLLVKRDEVINVLENELEAYREKYGPIREEGFMGYGVEVDEVYHGRSDECVSPAYSSAELKNGGEQVCNGPSSVLPEENVVEGTQDSSQKSLRRPRSGRLARLKNLEKTVQVLSDNGAPSSMSTTENVNHLEKEAGKGIKARFLNELSLLHTRVKALEADDGYVKPAGHVLQNGGEKGRILADIQDNLQKLCHFVANSFDGDNDA